MPGSVQGTSFVTPAYLSSCPLPRLHLHYQRAGSAWSSSATRQGPCTRSSFISRTAPFWRGASPSVGEVLPRRWRPRRVERAALLHAPRAKFAIDSLLEGDGFELPVPREIGAARRCPKDFGSSPSTVRPSAACNRISGPAPDCRSADTGIRRAGRRRPPRCSGYAYHPIARRAAAGLHRLGAAGEDRYTVPPLLPCQTAPYRHTLAGPLFARICPSRRLNKATIFC